MRFCLNGKKSEWEIVAVRNCPMGFFPVGYCRVGNCLGENVSSEKMTVNRVRLADWLDRKPNHKQ